MRDLFPAVYGNAAIKAQLHRAIVSHAVPHAMILEGPTGCGKHLLARELSAALLCENKQNESLPLPCGACEACRKVRENLYPDIRYILPAEGKTQIAVGQIKELRAELSLGAVESSYRLFILEADALNTAAQNALLISLEEPPEGVIFLLLCASPDVLLPTVRSRCLTLRMSRFSSEELGAYLPSVEPRFRKLLAESPERAAILLENSRGTVGGALELLREASLNKILKAREPVDGILAALERGSFSALYTAFHALPTEKRTELSDALALLADALRDLILLKRDPNAVLTYYSDRAQATELAEGLGLRALFALSDATDRAMADLLRNANVAILLETLIHAAKAGV